MPLNLITDPWIPVRCTDGRRVIRPDQIAEPDVLFPDWPRADLNIACLELLIGLVYLADPVDEVEDWAERGPDPERLRAALEPLAPAFSLGGDGPRFLQDQERFEAANGKVEIASPDMLFIDSAGGNTARNNADLMVRRGRYPRLDPALAAMALFTLQSQAPAGGAGNRTSMRGGGPMVTLVQPAMPGLWHLIWANVPLGRPQGHRALPWMAPTRRSEGGVATHPPEDGNLAEAFFGMPRRLRLIFEGDQVTGVLQKPYGANYAEWEHPLTPHYRMKDGGDLLPQHPRAGAFGYRNWLGINAASHSDLRRQAAALTGYRERVDSTEGAAVIVAGWAMDNMKPRDFILSLEPLIADGETLDRIHRMVAAAEICAPALRQSLKPVMGEGTALDALREEFFLRTQGPFEALSAQPGNEAQWLDEMRQAALRIFDGAATSRLGTARITEVEGILRERNLLLRLFSGQGKLGAKLYAELRLASGEKAA
ncbi:type I-E CRISPR-associated protein Cse1/CasA [Paracoccus aestuarii]|uniref:Type I-E CRISPR-associated protein Cse1/CasA n=1 Tax=Paracoccus aestuarii TaxID=453842 RepID=A0A418ZV00_9RHOB|nr:type I-E CRISPR-associated protein Cse1/CasA [Paracoccus aestuarii]RJL02369.1 type I-E CRISPR-associated protein Cse1/CasA [Paracoccus aestuarii]WCR00984.1 type I-E CRISPR-associated protein Cse1/CasA [Paracoccus aestuarii]